MTNLNVWQQPATNERQIGLKGDELTITLTLSTPAKGRACLRTTLGRGAIMHQEIIDAVELGAPRMKRAWDDIPMQATSPTTFTCCLPLTEVGIFKAKAYFAPEDDSKLLWPAGEDLTIKVEPAATVCGNTMYSAFVRQFRDASLSTNQPPDDESDAIHQLDRAGYTVIPPSGTFRILRQKLDLIMDQMGFRILQLLPIHPSPTTYARMGRFGSPFAALDFLAVDPAMAEFDRRATPMDQFVELIDAVHARDGMLFMDLPVNHTGWASRLQTHHPDWFVRKDDRTFVSPGAWGITWEDLSELDYAQRGLWSEMAEVFLFWCRRGVDGFRCDAGYMIPSPVWEYICAKVRREFPDTIFMLEGLGGKLEVMERLIGEAGLNWAYSEIFQNFSQRELEAYLPRSYDTSLRYGNLIQFAETHDNNRLAAESVEFARHRTALCALTAPAGAFGIANGVEWFCCDKIVVHGATSLNWGADGNQVEHITALIRVLDNHAAFRHGAALQVIPQLDNPALVVRRCAPQAGVSVLVVANLDMERSITARWPASQTPCRTEELVDLVHGTAATIQHVGDMDEFVLAPGQVCALGEQLPGEHPLRHDREPAQATRQRAKALLQQARQHGLLGKTTAPLDEATVTAFLANPAQTLRHDETAYQPITPWGWPHDADRVVMVPPGHVVMMQAPHPFTVDITTNGNTLQRHHSVPCARDRHVALIAPEPAPARALERTMRLTIFTQKGTEKRKSTLCYLAPFAATPPRLSCGPTLAADPLTAGLLTNGRGAMAYVRAAWGSLHSQYDALLAANLSSSVPVDRHIFLTRCRAWLRNRDYSHEINLHCLEQFEVIPGDAIQWRFRVPTGMGQSIGLTIRLVMPPGRNEARLHIQREPCLASGDGLSDHEPVSLILRPDIESRSMHEQTKAYLGAERHWPGLVESHAKGFVFSSVPGHPLSVDVSAGTFHREDEWTYQLQHEFEAGRGIEPTSDLYSPGFFEVELAGAGSCTLSATSDARAVAAAPLVRSATVGATGSNTEQFLAILQAGIRDFIVARDDSLTVIAGYPWFLDWGRDTLICLRGILAAGMVEETREIIRQFARFEKGGTLPNMIRGNDDRNRDTSDAPLWFFIACQELGNATDRDELLAMRCGDRTLKQVLISLGEHILAGTTNGIYTDPDSGLVFSPSHFTWMDTNYPAGTPRQGYPIEIQALWFAATRFLGEITGEARWNELSVRVRRAITDYYVLPDGYLADCLHAAPGQGAAEAEVDDACRCNQLMAITLGAVVDPPLLRGIIEHTWPLIVPGGIRSLADQPVARPLPIWYQEQLTNDPQRPYWGHYEGEEDTRRKPAYHNGTAWSWVFPHFAEALVCAYGTPASAAALALLGGSSIVLEQGCIGHIPEVMDGNAPHQQRGCGAQAWGATELYRVTRLITQANKGEPT
jgi:starch synthase (maltosyl-transferring)